ncbi:unnamed protein product [Adineta steineri]|uniref:6-bladed beta-propeller n=1 Tax=Adineta steineri TaxID=433720 RepID=A0A813SCR6_9BILA|nr:unnamed protein product [Adineta steineri]
MLFLDQLGFPINATWKQNGTTVAGGHGTGNELNQLDNPHGIYVDDDEEATYIADMQNNRIVQWKFNTTSGEIIAGENGSDELFGPTDVTVDKKNDSLIICEHGRSQVVRWSLRNRRKQGIIIQDISCFSLVMNDNGDLYVSTYNNVRRWRERDASWIIVAGGDKLGSTYGLLHNPEFIFVDQTYSIYVSDTGNQRVMKWTKDAKVGDIVAGRSIHRTDLNQLYNPSGVLVDHFNRIYVADRGSHGIMRWISGATEGEITIGGKGEGADADQLNVPYDISFDRYGNIYVVDQWNNRVQKFELDSS